MQCIGDKFFLTAVITEAYLSGIISIGGLFAGLLSNAGIGMMVLFRTNSNMKENITIVALSCVLSAIGYPDLEVNLCIQDLEVHLDCILLGAGWGQVDSFLDTHHREAGEAGFKGCDDCRTFRQTAGVVGDVVNVEISL